MVMLTPDNGPLRPQEGGTFPTGDGQVEGAPTGGGLSAFDTLRTIALGRDWAGMHRLLGAARQAVCTGDASGIMWIVAAQQLEHEGEITRTAAAFLVASFAEDTAVASCDSDPELAEITRRVEEIERASGLRPGEYWRIGEGPPEWQAAEREWEGAFDRLWQALLRRFGEHELADLLEHDRGEFERRVHSGEVALFG